VKIRNTYKIFIGKPEGKRTLGGHKRRWNDNIKIGLREIEWEGVNWIHLAQGSDWWPDL
jgi:hypothetical protein